MPRGTQGEGRYRLRVFTACELPAGRSPRSHRRLQKPLGHARRGGEGQARRPVLERSGCRRKSREGRPRSRRSRTPCQAESLRKTPPSPGRSSSQRTPPAERRQRRVGYPAEDGRLAGSRPPARRGGASSGGGGGHQIQAVSLRWACALGCAPSGCSRRSEASAPVSPNTRRPPRRTPSLPPSESLLRPVATTAQSPVAPESRGTPGKGVGPLSARTGAWAFTLAPIPPHGEGTQIGPFPRGTALALHPLRGNGQRPPPALSVRVSAESNDI